MINWIHKLLNPHCVHCEQLRDKWKEESEFCRSCEDLRMELAYFKQLNESLMNRLLGAPNQITLDNQEAPVSISTNRKIPWAVKRQQLEAEDRLRAIQLKENVKIEQVTVEDLESELKINDSLEIEAKDATI